MTGNKVAQKVALHDLKRLEQTWRKQMESVLKLKLPAADTVATIQEMTVVEGALCRLMIELEGKLK